MDDREQTGNPAPVPAPALARRSIVDGEEHPVDPRSVRIARITVGWAVGGIPIAVYLPLLGGLLLLLAYK